MAAAAAAAGGTRTRSGGLYNLRVADAADVLARGSTRTGKSFRRFNRGHYKTIKQLEVAHERLFSPRPVFFMAGERPPLRVCVCVCADAPAGYF
jgi:hypothetical protein